MAEDATRSVGIVENAKIQRVEELETLLNEYKSTNLQLVQELDAIGGDSSSLGRGRTRKDLADEIEVERVAKFEAQTGKLQNSLYPLIYRNRPQQHYKRRKPCSRNT